MTKQFSLLIPFILFFITFNIHALDINKYEITDSTSPSEKGAFWTLKFADSETSIPLVPLGYKPGSFLKVECMPDTFATRWLQPDRIASISWRTPLQGNGNYYHEAHIILLVNNSTIYELYRSVYMGSGDYQISAKYHFDSDTKRLVETITLSAHDISRYKYPLSTKVRDRTYIRYENLTQTTEYFIENSRLRELSSSVEIELDSINQRRAHLLKDTDDRSFPLTEIGSYLALKISPRYKKGTYTPKIQISEEELSNLLNRIRSQNKIPKDIHTTSGTIQLKLKVIKALRPTNPKAEEYIFLNQRP